MNANDEFTGLLTEVGGIGQPGLAARTLAAAGVPVFPVVPGGKRPLTLRGFHDASTDPGQVEAWWAVRPAANIGMPTGAASGVVVVDVDVHGGVDGHEAMLRADRAGLVDGWLFLVTTPSGGTHAYYPAHPAGSGVEQRSWQAARAGVDFRGDGGYVVVPPSVVVRDDSTRAGYQVRQTRTDPGRVLDADRLRDFLDPKPAPRQLRSPGVSGGRADVERLAAWVARGGKGERNRGLFWAACRLAENDIAPGEALDVLTGAAGQAGLDDREIATTIRSAYRTVHGGGTARQNPAPAHSDFPALHVPTRSAQRSQAAGLREWG